MLLLKILGGLLKALNGDVHPMQIAGGAWIGCMLGLSPFLGPHTAVLIVLLLVFRVNLGGATLLMGVGKLAGIWAKARICEPVGEWMLTPGNGMRPLVVRILDTPVLGLADLENHAVLGGLVVGFGLGAVLALPIVLFIGWYRGHVREGFRRSKTARWMSRTWIFRIFKGLTSGVDA